MTGCSSICAQNCPDACKNLGFSSIFCHSTCGISCSIAFSSKNTYAVSYIMTSSGLYHVAVMVKNVHVHSPFVNLFAGMKCHTQSGHGISFLGKCHSFEKGYGLVFRSIICFINCNKWHHKLVHNIFFRQILQHADRCRRFFRKHCFVLELFFGIVQHIVHSTCLYSIDKWFLPHSIHIQCLHHDVFRHTLRFIFFLDCIVCE
jgi:hypothetical protein